MRKSKNRKNRIQKRIVKLHLLLPHYFVESRVYDIYARKNSNEKATLLDTGKDITVGNSNEPS